MIIQKSFITFFVGVFASSSSSWWNDGHHGHHAGWHQHHAFAQEQEHGTIGVHGGHPNHGGSDGLFGLVAGDPLDPPDPSSDVKGDSNGVGVGVGVGASMGRGDLIDPMDPMDPSAVMLGDSDGIVGHDDGVTTSYDMVDNSVKGAATSDGKVIDLVSGGQFTPITPIDPSSFGVVGDGKVLEGVVARTRKLGKGSKGNPTRSRLNECIAALIGTYTFNCCCGGGIYSVTILCNNYDCNYTEEEISATTCPDDTSEPSTCVFSGTFDAREVIDLSTCDVTKMITASYDRPECAENDFNLDLPEEKSTTPIGLQIQNVLPNDGVIDISFIRMDRSPKRASVPSSFEGRRIEAIRYSDNAEEGHRLLAAASEFEMKALMETHRRYLGCESGFCIKVSNKFRLRFPEGVYDTSMNSDPSKLLRITERCNRYLYDNSDKSGDPSFRDSLIACQIYQSNISPIVLGTLKTESNVLEIALDLDQEIRASEVSSLFENHALAAMIDRGCFEWNIQGKRVAYTRTEYTGRKEYSAQYSQRTGFSVESSASYMGVTVDAGYEQSNDNSGGIAGSSETTYGMMQYSGEVGHLTNECFNNKSFFDFAIRDLVKPKWIKCWNQIRERGRGITIENLLNQCFAGVVEGELQEGTVLQGSNGSSEGGVYRISERYNFVRMTLPEPLTGDFKVSSEILFEKMEVTAASFVLWDEDGAMDHVGFDGVGKRMFYEGNQWGSAKYGGPGPSPNVWLDVLLTRIDGKLTVSVDGAAVLTDLPCNWTIQGIGWRPHRNTIQLRSLEECPSVVPSNAPSDCFKMVSEGGFLMPLKYIYSVGTKVELSTSYKSSSKQDRSGASRAITAGLSATAESFSGSVNTQITKAVEKSRSESSFDGKVREDVKGYGYGIDITCFGKRTCAQVIDRSVEATKDDFSLLGKPSSLGREYKTLDDILKLYFDSNWGLPDQFVPAYYCSKPIIKPKNSSRQCAHDFNIDLQGRAYQCPDSFPFCVNYINGNRWGTCSTATMTIGSGTGESKRRIDCAHNHGRSGSYVCPSSRPYCVDYNKGTHWGACASTRPNCPL